MTTKFKLFLLALVGFSFTIIGCKKQVINGINGSNGSNGFHSLIKTSPELPGLNCSGGGLKVDIGLDSNRNGVLENVEIKTTSYLCNSSGTSISFSATISQMGTNPPVNTIIHNSLNLTITWSRTAQGRFKGILNQSLDLTKTIILSNNIDVHCKFQSSNEISLDYACGVNAWCDGFSNFNLQIIVY